MTLSYKTLQEMLQMHLDGTAHKFSANNGTSIIENIEINSRIGALTPVAKLNQLILVE